MKYLKDGGFSVKIRENGKVFLLLYLFGFLFGIFYANTISKEFIMNIGIFNDSYLKHYLESSINEQKYALYLMKIRSVPFILLLILGLTKLRKMIAAVFLVWTGFLIGVITSVAVMKLGIVGIFFNIISLFPHFIFYGLEYIILLLNISRRDKVKWSPFSLAVMILLFVMGVIMESYINPVLMKMFLKTV